MRRMALVAVLLLAVACSAQDNAGSSADSSADYSRGYIYLSLQRLNDLDRSFRDAHYSIEAMFDTDPYSAEGKAAIDAAQKAWGDLAFTARADPFLPEQEEQNTYIAPALEAVASAADAWLDLLDMLAFSSRTHILPEHRGPFRSLTGKARHLEADAFTALLKAEDETHRQYCEPFIGADPPEPGCQIGLD